MNNLHNEKSYCTQSTVVKLRYTWTIQNYSFFFIGRPEVLKSLPFFADDYKKIVFCLELRNEQIFTLISLKILSSGDTNVRAKFKIHILNDKQEILFSSLTSPLIFRSETEHVGNFNLSNCIFNDELKILCEIEFMVNGKDISDVTVDKSEYSMRENFEKFLNNEKFCDVILVAGDREFPAHKSILAARSDVFAAMFEHDMEESRLNRVTITDINHDVFKELLHFIYTDKAPNVDKMACDLFSAADKYALEGLKAMCEQSLSDNLSITTATQTLLLADRHSATYLKEKTMAFVKANAHVIATTQEWKNLMTTHSHLIAEVFAYIFS